MLNDDVFPLEVKFDHQRLLEECIDLKIDTHQCYVTSTDGHTYDYSADAIKHADLVGKSNYESLFTTMNRKFKGTYIEEVVNEVDSMFDVTRVRIMMLDDKRRAYSMHRDSTCRLHLPIATNSDSMFICDSRVYYMNDLGRLYFANTQKKHTAYNGGSTPRIK